MYLSRTRQSCSFLLTILFILCVIKILFVGYDIDEQYAAAMSYRMLKGDFPLLDMWEPHQTSGFLSAFFMLPYLAVTGTTTGIILYLRICGLLCHTCVTVLLYQTLRRFLDKDYSLLLCCIFFLSLPKFMLFPEFSNMQLWFLMLCIIFLMQYYATGSPLCLTGAGLFLSLEILTYPSTVFSFFACLFCIIRHHGRLLQRHSLSKELAYFILPCTFCAAAFFAMLLSRLSFSQIWELLSVIANDGSHCVPLSTKFLAHTKSLLEILLLLFIYASAATAFYAIFRKCKLCQGLSFLWGRLLLLCSLLGQVGIWLLGNQYPGYPSLEYVLFPLGAVILTTKKERSTPVFTLFIIVPLVAFPGILLFSNHPFIVSLPYLAPCSIGALALLGLGQHSAPLKERPDFFPRFLSLRSIVLLWLIVLIFGRCYMVRTTGGTHYTAVDKLSLMREGPALGIIADRETVRRYRINYTFITDNLPKDVRIFYAGVSSDFYLMKDMGICTPSTISTPTFDDKVTSYFRTHPDKLPQYIVCEADLPDMYTDGWLSCFIRQYCSETPVFANDFLLIYTISYML